MDVWENNPLVRKPPFPRRSPLRVGYTRAICEANGRRGHFMQGMLFDICSNIGELITPNDIRPHIKLTEKEMDPRSAPLRPGYWIVMPGGKTDFPLKMWSLENYLSVCRTLASDGIRIVQCGGVGGRNITRRLPGVYDLTGKTTFREFLVAVYHSAGVICPVTSGMHAAAAFNRPCVVIAGGREPWWWEAYTKTVWRDATGHEPPDDFVPHRFIHSIGSLPCCRRGGCWNTGFEGRRACVDIVSRGEKKQPRCLDKIVPYFVVSAVRAYLNGDPVIEDEFPPDLAPSLLTR